MSEDETQLDFLVNVLGLESILTAAHFHVAVAGENGGVVRGFNEDEITVNPNGAVVIQGTWDLTALDLLNLRAGAIYVNVHTEGNPSGEVRGQVLADE